MRLLRKKLASSLFRWGPVRRAIIQNVAQAGRLMGDRWGASRSWSEGEEDTVLMKEAEDSMEAGFYVDIGANLPLKRSNTYRLYCAGMHGVCVEPNLELATIFERVRPRDSVLNMAVGKNARVAELARFNFHVFSTCSLGEAERRLTSANPTGLNRVLVRSKVAMMPLHLIFEEALPKDRNEFFLLKVDTEGFDLEVLQSNNWKRFRPRLVLTEGTGEQKEISDFLSEKGYHLERDFGENQLFKKEIDGK